VYCAIGVNIAHLTSVHHRRDPRIFAKQAVSAAAHGYRVTVVVADGCGPELMQGVNMVDLGRPPLGRFGRMLFTPWRAATWLWRARPELLVVHDPELLPLALAWRWLTRSEVIYDVHEDNVAFVHHKEYLPGWLRGPVAASIAALEGLARRTLRVVIAEPAYAARFPGATLIPNYPDLDAFAEQPRDLPPELASLAAVEAPVLIYTGNVSLERGALVHTRLLHHHPDVHVALVGYTPPALAATLLQEAGRHHHRLHLIGVDRYLDHATLRAAMRLPNILAGLALFPRHPFYDEKELTKFFEYMAVGLPVLASDSPTWSRLLERDAGCGVTVNPDDAAAQGEVLQRWLADRAAARALGERGRARVHQFYTWRQACGVMLGLYRGMM
jgi:glycosyltransferase involved in cell wall biosynthesis